MIQRGPKRPFGGQRKCLQNTVMVRPAGRGNATIVVLARGGILIGRPLLQCREGEGAKEVDQIMDYEMTDCMDVVCEYPF